MRWWVAAAAGLAAGAIASAAMEAYQLAAAPLFEADEGDGDPSTVKAADTLSEVAGSGPVAPDRRALAGRGVHYATGLALGVGYSLLAARRPAVTAARGTAFGVVSALVLDDVLVPAFGWGPPPSQTGPATHLYALTAHLVFGAVLEETRRGTVALLA